MTGPIVRSPDDAQYAVDLILDLRREDMEPDVQILRVNWQDEGNAALLFQVIAGSIRVRWLANPAQSEVIARTISRQAYRETAPDEAQQDLGL